MLLIDQAGAFFFFFLKCLGVLREEVQTLKGQNLQQKK